MEVVCYFLKEWSLGHSGCAEKDEINVPIALSVFRDGDQGPSKVTKTELDVRKWSILLLKGVVTGS